MHVSEYLLRTLPPVEISPNPTRLDLLLQAASVSL